MCCAFMLRNVLPTTVGAPLQPSEEFDLVPGDRIKVNLDKDLWKLMQESCGEWREDMSMVRSGRA